MARYLEHLKVDQKQSITTIPSAQLPTTSSQAPINPPVSNTTTNTTTTNNNESTDDSKTENVEMLES